MAKTPIASGDLEVLLERLQALEARIARLEGDSQAAGAIAADFAALAAAPAVEGQPAGVASGTASAGAELGASVPRAERRDAAFRSPADRPQPVGEISEEVLLVLSAAVAAFLGERAHVRQVRLLHSDAWAQQGRVSVMASHRWAVHR